MSIDTPANPDAVKQSAYTTLTNLYNTAQAASNNPSNSAAARDAAFDLMSATSTQLDALDQAAFSANTIDLQAAAAAMAPGVAQLKALQSKIAALGNDFQESGAILSGIDKVIGELTAIG
jgi:hypothetical protein